MNINSWYFAWIEVSSDTSVTHLLLLNQSTTEQPHLAERVIFVSGQVLKFQELFHVSKG